jgi:hypothetical protein
MWLRAVESAILIKCRFVHRLILSDGRTYLLMRQEWKTLISMPLAAAGDGALLHFITTCVASDGQAAHHSRM